MPVTNDLKAQQFDYEFLCSCGQKFKGLFPENTRHLTEVGCNRCGGIAKRITQNMNSETKRDTT